MNNAQENECKPSILQHDGTKSFDAQSLVGLGIWFACVLYSSIRTSTNSQVAKITMSERILMKDTSSGTYLATNNSRARSLSACGSCGDGSLIE